MIKSNTPIIGITVDTNYGQETKTLNSGFDPKGNAIFWLKKAYTDAVEKSGGVPLLLPLVSSPAKAALYLTMIDGLIISGGEFDIDPALYGEKPIPQCGALKPDRTIMEMALLKKALKLSMPVLGICGGHQAINVAFGGSLYQDIPTQAPAGLKHEQKPVPATQPSHDVDVASGTILGKIAGQPKLRVNSTHHQAIKKIGKGLSPCGVSPDGIIESVEKKGASFLLGVQWHPEQLYNNDEASRKIFKRFVAESRKYRKASRR
ncbi:MAG: gamma-glutamyl-gamma-aminobutyrate hydrolase family protein [Nitrospinae bacterium]|nr:gamma-glutamyl-gamma-aminobutyrate hydrolase family protein [Nitrospinota bacterium]